MASPINPVVVQATYTSEQVYLAYAVLLLVVLLALRLYLTGDYGGLDERQKEHKQALERGRERQAVETVTVSEWSQQVRDRLRHALTDADANPQEPSAVESARAHYRELLSRLHGYLPPPIPRYLVLGLLIPVAGYIAVRTGWVVAAIKTPYSGPGLAAEGGQLMMESVGITIGVISLWSNWLPGSLAGLLADGWTWAYRRPLLVGVILLTAGAGLLFAEYRGRPYDRQRVETAGLASIASVARTVTGAALGIWAIGVVPGVILHQVGLGGIGLLLAAGLTGIATAVTASLTLVSGIRRLDVLRSHPGGRWLILEAAYRRIAGGAAGVGLLLLVGYTWVAIADGRLLQVLEALPDAHPLKLALILIAVLVPAGVGVFLLWDTIRDALAWLQSLVARRGVYALAVARGARWTLVILGIAFGAQVVGSGLGGGLIGALVGAAIGATIALTVSVLVQRQLRRARLRLNVGEDDRPGAGHVQWHCYEIADADGQTMYLAEAIAAGRVTQLAHRDPQPLLDTMEAVTHQYLAGERVEPSFEEWLADRALNQGLVNVEDNWKRAREHARKLLVNPLRENHGRADKREIEDLQRRDSTPQAAVDEWLETEYFTEDGDTIRLLADPWT